MLSWTSGSLFMDIRDLVDALAGNDTLAARQWVADAMRDGIRFGDLKLPVGLNPTELAIAAGLVEMFCERAGCSSPDWTGLIGKAPETVLLVRAAQSMPRLRRLCEEEGPEPLRRR